ncbi:hypothetical protein [Pseudobacteriovorax antillogorgiicola]|uniref:Uncharacterized protein n=1 Tax=Pseudobacteriovorax antillogorgiicola TaxID=1513793 RepID=A0A1Y6BJQ6_9BACT|nr:hypothetical protein [Pseudobacteriovorax antillogorgiicola]TCS55306.1 hypothetical protein EDD56_10527 [Pseudobacteriovorax antillogorgiicola]SMF14410.1 hypothetical protein SAMN06296036_105297 [Pseudobacteriovorax antillogorgiicola]
MLKIFTLGHISPMATHLICFILGMSMLFIHSDDEKKGPWQGVRVSLRRTQVPKNVSFQMFLVKKFRGEICLVSFDPVLFDPGPTESPSVLLPRKEQSLPWVRGLVSGKVKLQSQREGLPLCSELEGRIRYG